MSSLPRIVCDAARQTLRALFDLSLPALCPLCRAVLAADERPSAMCAVCLRALPPLPTPHCPCCALPFVPAAGDDHLCGACLKQPPAFSWSACAGIYEGLWREAIRHFKFDARLELEKPLAEVLYRRLGEKLRAFAPELLVPVPLHPARLRERGFNQSWLLARRLGNLLGVPASAELLRRSRATIAQQGLGEKERHGNLRGAFAAHLTVAPKRVVLLDDVITSTATVRECARVLRGAGVNEVVVVALTRAPRIFS